MTAQTVTELMAARRYLTNVLLHMSISADDMSVRSLLELLDHFAENPTEYLNFIND